MEQYILVSTWFNGSGTVQIFLTEAVAMAEYSKPLLHKEANRKLFKGQMMAEKAQ